MSRINPRALAAIVSAAFLLRLGTAVVTERHPLFPAYYYTDARIIDASSQGVMDRLDRGESYAFAGTLGQRTQVLIQTGVYRLIGVHPFAMKFLNCALGAVAVAAFAAAVLNAFGPLTALASAALLAVWPSNVFYASQNFKEAPNNLLAYLALAFLLPLACKPARRSWLAPFAACGVFCLLGAGFYRSYVMLTLSAALAAAFLGAWAARRTPSLPLALGLAAALCAPILFLPVSRFATTHWFGTTLTDDPRTQSQLLPMTYDAKTEHRYLPTSPLGLSEFRRIRQESDRNIARESVGREIGTQIFPGARFDNWLDVLMFLPKSAFYVLFMPLPGLYPMDGKIGRLAAALENLVILLVSGLAAAGAIRGPRTPARAAMLLFFMMMAAGSSLLEFDLGSAGRHKLLYLPMLFPFAAEELLRRLGRKEPA